MQTLYKLTSQGGWTRYGYANALLWANGVSHTATGSGVELCTEDVIHAYLSPELALFLNPTNAGIYDPILWECKGVVVAREGELKVGVKTLTITSRIRAVEPTTEQRVKFAILCALSVYKNTAFEKWAQNWLSGMGRAAGAAAWAARAAAWAAEAAAKAAEAAETAAKAAEAARAAETAAWAAEAAGAAGSINLIELAKEAMA